MEKKGTTWWTVVISLPRRCFSQSGSLSAFVSFRSASLFDLFPSSNCLFPRPRLLAGVINDLTDTLNERCRESVKQVVIKTDAVPL